VTAAALLLLALAAGVLGGCGQSAAPSPAASAPDTSIANLTQMTPAEKASQIATSFPLQVPVAAGLVVRAQAQSETAWDYQIIVPGKVAPVRNWYLSMYRNAEWTVTSGSDTEVTLEKGTAQTKLQFQSMDDGSGARTQVSASVGVGTPVLQTQ
jgi:hypothetical protein